MPDAEAFETGFGRYAARRFEKGVSRASDERLLEETPVALSYNDQPHAVILATPTDLEDFAVGFSLTEGIVESGADITELDVIPSRHGVAIMMRIPEERAARLGSMRRNLPGMGGCGLCGIEKLDAVLRMPPRVGTRLRITAQALERACRAMPGLQAIGRQTGAAHAAVLARADGEPESVREDAARHTAMDKLVGHLARSGIPAGDGFVLMSSRASYELVQKAASAGFELMAAVSAPTGLAVRIALATGITLVAFAREGRFTCYANEYRLIE
jgi:FdhD protein